MQVNDFQHTISSPSLDLALPSRTNPIMDPGTSKSRYVVPISLIGLENMSACCCPPTCGS